MKPLSKCQMCGKSVRGSLLCEECEREVLEKQRTKRYLLSALAGVVMVVSAYLLWRGFQERRSEVEPQIIVGLGEKAWLSLSDFARSPYMLVPTIIVLVLAALYFGVKLSK